MKKIKKLLVILFALLLVVGCTNNKAKDNDDKDKQEKVVDIAGRTFYNINLRAEQSDYSEIWFGKDNSFVFKDEFFDGYYSITGTYEVNENVIKLTSDNSDVECYKKFIFEISDEHSITLKNDLAGSIMNDVFKDEKPQGNTVEYSDRLYNVRNESYIDFYQDGSFTLTEIDGYGAIEINGSWDMMGDTVTFCCFDPFLDLYGNEVYNFELVPYAENAYSLSIDLISSYQDDIFTYYDYLSEYQGYDSNDSYGAYYVHEPIDGTPDEYLPYIDIDSMMNFIFWENVYAGMSSLSGWVEPLDNGFVCYVEQNNLQGFAGEDVTTIVFEYLNDYQAVLKTDICMSRSGDIFNYSY